MSKPKPTETDIRESLNVEDYPDEVLGEGVEELLLELDVPVIDPPQDLFEVELDESLD